MIEFFLGFFTALGLGFIGLISMSVVFYKKRERALKDGSVDGSK